MNYQAISGENFSQSEYVAVGAIFQFAFPPLAKGVPSCVPFHKSFERRFLYSQSISSNLCVFGRRP